MGFKVEHYSHTVEMYIPYKEVKSKFNKFVSMHCDLIYNISDSLDKMNDNSTHTRLVLSDIKQCVLELTADNYPTAPFFDDMQDQYTKELHEKNIDFVFDYEFRNGTIKDVRQWLIDSVGNNAKNLRVVFKFHDAKDAIHFKLVFGGQ